MNFKRSNHDRNKNVNLLKKRKKIHENGNCYHKLTWALNSIDR